MNNDMLPVGTTIYINPEDIKWEWNGGDLISRKALKEKISNTFIDGALKSIIIDFIDNAPTVGIATKLQPNCNNLQQGEWIPIAEKLPNTLGVYNVTRKLNEGETIYFISDASYFDGQNTWHNDVCVNHGRPYLTDIIAWQPRPEPYNEGGAKE